MDLLVALGLDLVLIVGLVFGVYYPRHRRGDLIVAFLVVNIGVFALTEALSGMSLGAGFGIGMFGVLSIIRLRSSEIDQRDVAYYFASLVIGLVSALVTIGTPTTGLLGLLVVLALLIVDRKNTRTEHCRVRLDHVYGDRSQLEEALERQLAAEVVSLRILEVDNVDDSTTVDATFRVREAVKS